MSFQALTTTVNGASVAFRRGGAGQPLLFLHGADGLAEWPAILDDLAQRFDVIVPDLPGFGKTAAPDFIDDMSDVAYFGLDLVESLLPGQKVRILGHSLGGWMALEMAIRSTAQIRSLALIAPAGIHVKGLPKADIYMIDPDAQARLAYADPALGEAAAQRALAAKYQEQAIRDRIASARLGWSPRLYNPRLERWLHRVRVPCQIIWGDTDRIIPPGYGPVFARSIPDARLEAVPVAGHYPHIERQVEVRALLDRFFA